MLQLPKLFVNIKEFVSQEGLIWVDLTLHKAMLFFFLLLAGAPGMNLPTVKGSTILGFLFGV